MTIAAAYLRVSKSDNTANEESLTLETQRTRIKALCVARGWTYGPEYIDEGVSATKSRATGTRWSQMLSEVGNGTFDVIVARDLDRLLRTLQDLVKLIDIGAKVATVDGEIDLTTADGEFRATMLAAVARFEIRRKSERAIGANETRRRMGTPISRARILGYDEDGVTQIDDEAEAVRKAFEDFLAGVGVTQVAKELTEKGYTTSKGKPWGNSNIRSLLMNTRYKGVISKWDPEKKGQVLGSRKARYSSETYPGNFEPIVSASVFDAVQFKLNDPLKQRHWSSAPKYLLVSLAYCGRCDDGHSTLVTGFYHRSPRTMASGEVKTYEPVRTYICKNNTHLSRTAEPVEKFINEVIEYRLAKGDLVAALRPRRKRFKNTDDLKFDQIALQERLKGLARLYADGVLGEDEVREESAQIKARLNEIDDLLAPQPANVAYEIASSPDPVAAWRSTDLTRRRLFLAQVMQITLLPSKRGAKGFDPNLVRVDWLI